MKKILLIGFIVTACVVFFGMSRPVSNAQKAIAPAPVETLKEKTFSRVINSAKLTGAVRVIVGFDTAFRPEGELDRPQMAKQRLGIKQAQESFLGRFRSASIRSVKHFEYIPFLAFETDAAGLEQMQNDPAILSLQEDIAVPPNLAESTVVIGATTAWASGFSGSGQTIAILDTGVAKNNPFLAGKVISEACYSTNIVGTDPINSLCPGSVTESTAVDSALNCPSNVSQCYHGTYVAGIAAGKGATFSGVAKDANLIAIQVFSQINSATSCGTTPAPCVSTFTSDHIKGLERVRTLNNTIPIAAVNMSFGGGQNFSACDTTAPATKAAIDNLRSVGVASVVASGNNGFTNAISYPACISTAISVGSTNDGSSGFPLDVVSSFSNSASILNMLAPGRAINSSMPDGTFANLSGTSAAAPHVAGAIGILRQRVPQASVSKIQRLLTNTGLPITDTRNAIVKPRIRVMNALQALVRPPFDYDGDGKTDISVFRPSSGVWYVQNSADGSFAINQWGLSTDLTVPADYDGDGKTDVAVWRSSNGVWFWINSSNSTVGGKQWGLAGDTPAPGDYDGDGKADTMIYRASVGQWWIDRSSDGNVSITFFGLAEDKPAAGDFDGDGITDVSLFRPSNATWYRLNSTTGFMSINTFGLSEDKPVAGDYDGDSKTDIAIFRPSNGAWYWINSSNNSIGGVLFGLTEDKPTPGDYDGDGKSDPAVFRPSQSTWYLLRSTQGFTAQQFGASGDIPTPNSFVP